MDWTPLDEPTLVLQLNALLTSLCIPIPLISPTDLTPRLLIAILELILGQRLPTIDRQDDSRVSKIHKMKLFLGVLETDILKVDVGLSQVDPYRLACGEREEVVFIAELLCWIGRRMKLIDAKRRKAPSISQAREPHSPTVIAPPTSQRSRKESYSKPLSQLDLDSASAFQSGSTFTDHSTPRNNSPFTSHPLDDESFTSVNTGEHSLLQPPFKPKKFKQKEIEDDDALSSISDILSGLPETPNRNRRPRERSLSRCIHEVSTPSILGSPCKRPSTSPRISISHSSRNCYPEHSKDDSKFDPFDFQESDPPIRYNGYIEPVDEESEIASFNELRSMSTASEQSFDTVAQDDPPLPPLKSIREQYTRTLELLNERARLLTDLAKLKNSDPFR